MSDLYYDPYTSINDPDPYPLFQRMREEAPLYYNDKHDFYAVTRYEDCERGLVDAKRFISGRGGILELIKATSSSRIRPRMMCIAVFSRGSSRPDGSPRSNRRFESSARAVSIRW
jgi:hypothetical protein